MADDWKTWSFRQKVIHQLEELIRQTPPNQHRNAHDLELQVFQRSGKREEYMTFIARVIMYLRDMAQNNSQQQNNNPHLQAVLSAPGPATQMTGPGGHMTSTVPQMGGPSQNMSGTVGPGPGQMVSTAAAGVTGPNTTILAGQQPMQGNPRMGQPMPPSVQNQTGDISNWAGNNRRINDMQQIAGNKKQPNITMNQVGQPVKMNPIQIAITGQGGPTAQMGQVPTQIVGRAAGTMQPRVPSPGFQGSVTGIPRQGTPSSTSASPAPLSAPSNQPSPAFISPSPSMVPSPAGSSSGAMGRGTGHLGAPSPSGMLNTPGQPQQPSPAQCISSSQVDDAAYREKVRQLSKYIVPLRRVIERMGNEDVEKSRKMKQLYDMLQNPQKRMPMETLLKCEQVLIKLEMREEVPPTMDSRIAGLVDAVNNAFKHSWGSHTVHRTFSPALSVLLGPTYTSNPTKRFKRDNPLQPPPETPNISDIVQGEVARLNARFRVNLDCQQPPGSDDLTLICQLDDPNLPCVPPITLTIPSAYPMKTPRCDLLPVDYETTDFLKNIRESMLVRLKNMPPHCSLTMMLHSWEMSVRQACAPKPSLTSIVTNALVST
ncbi:mediator of RNA polymerase II transcription subunit 15-like isoform X1 [Macrobrachium nipponense]|uniref:mediator of RNA polymerase II transcription subunit 15-like isoform X1 n=1 Tax=Macrobrachium nipponense TaxID=159736 RepID=UPI0030C7F01A